MLDMTQLLTVFKHWFKDKSYGESLQDYISKRHPKSTSDIEHLERQWQYGNARNTWGQWI